MLKKTFNLVLIAVMVLAVQAFGPSSAHAAVNLTLSAMRPDRMKVSQVPVILVVIKPTSVAVETSVKITFDNNYTVNATAATITATTTGIPATYQGTPLVAWPGIGAAATTVVTKVVTFASTDLTVGTEYGFFITAGITNPAVPGQLVNQIDTQAAGPVVIDTARIATYVITNDQIVVSGVVPPIFTFALGANTDAFTADLSPATVNVTTGVTVTIGTNAAKGWVAWAKDAAANLSSPTVPSATLATTGAIGDAVPHTLAAGTPGYVMDVDLTTDNALGTGAVTIDPEYNGIGVASGGTLSTGFQPIASCTGTTAGDVITLIERTAINAVQPAAQDYTDTITVIGAGTF